MKQYDIKEVVLIAWFYEKHGVIINDECTLAGVYNLLRTQWSAWFEDLLTNGAINKERKYSNCDDMVYADLEHNFDFSHLLYEED